MRPTLGAAVAALVLTPLFPAAVVAASPSPAAADSCPSRACVTGTGDVAVEASHGGTSSHAGGGSDANPASNVAQACTWHGEGIPCHDEHGGWWSPTHQCYIRPMGGTRPDDPPATGVIEQEAPAGAQAGSGAWYGCQMGIRLSVLWLTTPPPVLPSPGELAQRAVATMNLAPITVGIVPKDQPGHVGVIGLPVWMWVEDRSPSTFGPITASATAGPMTVTAVGTVASIDWDMGDGTTVTCTGAGTAYQESFGKRKSPTCGHVYTRTSADQPGDRYGVTATSHWVVDWAGGGQSGTITLDHVATTNIAEGELQVLAL